MLTNLEKRLHDLEMDQIIHIYNTVSERKVTRMSDKTTAVKRTRLALDAARKDYVLLPSGQIVVRDAEVTAPVIDARTILTVAENPKRAGSASHARYALYRAGMTVGEFVAAADKIGTSRSKAIRDISWDSAHGYITLSPL